MYLPISSSVGQVSKSTLSKQKFSEGGRVPRKNTGIKAREKYM